MKFFTCLFVVSLLILSETCLAEKMEQGPSAEIILYNQLKSDSAIPFLTTASEAGDHEAQYFLAEALRKKNHYMDPEARKW